MAYQIKIQRERRRAPRIKVRMRAKVLVQLFGSQTKYQFETIDISESGLLLESSEKKVFYNKSSILEIWLVHDKREVYFTSKYIRKVNDQSFAVQISDIDPNNAKILQSILEEAHSFEKA